MKSKIAEMNGDLNQLMREDQAAAFINFTTRTLQAWRYRGGGPKYLRISARAIRYRKKDLIEWSETKARSSSSNQ